MTHDQKLRAMSRAHWWQSMREVCADIRAAHGHEAWLSARYQTLAYYFARYRAEREPQIEMRRAA